MTYENMYLVGKCNHCQLDIWNNERFEIYKGKLFHKKCIKDYEKYLEERTLNS